MPVSPGVLASYDFGGGRNWAESVGYTLFNGVTVDSNINIYAFGGNNTIGSIVKFDNSGNKKWGVQVSGVSSPKIVNPVALRTDASGNVYVAGYGGGYVNLMKFDSNGNNLWSYQGAGSLADNNSLAVDASGNSYFSFNTTNSYAVTSGYITKIGPSGNTIWSYGSGSILFGETSLDSSGNIYTFSSLSGILTKTTSSGKPVWTSNIVGGGNNSSMVVDASGNCYIAITTSPQNSYPYIATIFKTDSNGNYIWSYKYAGPYGNSPANWGSPNLISMTLDPTGSILFVSGVASEIGGPPILFRVSTANGNTIGNALTYSPNIGTNPNYTLGQSPSINPWIIGGAPGLGVAIDGNHNVYMANCYVGLFNSTTTSGVHSNVLKMSIDNLYYWSKSFFNDTISISNYAMIQASGSYDYYSGPTSISGTSYTTQSSILASGQFYFSSISPTIVKQIL